MSFILSYLRPEKKLLAIALFCALINQVFSLLDPQIFRIIIDKWVTKFTEYDMRTFLTGVGWLLLASITVAMVSRIAKNIQDYLVNKLTQQIGMQLYQQTLTHLFTLPYKIFEDQQSGQILEKLLKARQNIQVFIAALINILFVSLVGLLFVIIYASTVHRLIATLYATIVPVMGLVMTLLSKRIKSAQSAIVKESADLSGATTETLRNIALVKSLGLEQQELTRLENTNTRLLGLEIKKIKLIRILEFLQGTLINLMRVALMGTMFWLVYKQSITLGEFFSLYFYSMFIFRPLYQAGVVVQNYQEAKASDHIIQELLALGNDAIITYGDKSITTISSVAFDNVRFSYTEQASKTILENITRQAQAGETIAFVGPSGAGKSTIIKLLLGLYQPTQGTITINTTPFTQIAPKSLKQHIGYVAQESQLFAGTIRQNLQFVALDADDAAMYRALEAAQIGDLVRSSQEGLDTKIGEGGLKLSGGQRQRLSIARALLRQPSLLIFDEATSSLDTLVEADITRTIQSIAEQQHDMILIMIAHRLSTIQHADTIYVLEEGQIIETGDHTTLLQNKGLYYALWRQQGGRDIT